MKKNEEQPGADKELKGLDENFEYPPTEDIYKRAEEVDLDPEELITRKESETPGKMNEKAFNEDLTGEDLDIPGAELDDEMEVIGEEDEENNYYSLGGDNHADLEENDGKI